MKRKSLSCLVVLIGCLATANADSYPDRPSGVPELVIAPPEEGNWTAPALDLFDSPAVLEGLRHPAVVLLVAPATEVSNIATSARLCEACPVHHDTDDSLLAVFEINEIASCMALSAQHKPSPVWAVPKPAAAGIAVPA